MVITMDTLTQSKVKEEDKTIIKEIVNNYKKKGKIWIKQAFQEHPEFESALSHLPFSTILYWAKRIDYLENKSEKTIKKDRQEVQEKIKIPEQQDDLNFCPCCGRCLVNIRTAMRLESVK